MMSNLRFSDDFDAFDSTVWTRKFWFYGDAEQHYLGVYRDANVAAVANSRLGLSCINGTSALTDYTSSTRNDDGVPYSWTCAMISTGGISHGTDQGNFVTPSFRQQYGYFETCCAMPPRGNGFWTAFWMNNDDIGGNLEIDAFSFIASEPDRLHMNLHGPVEFETNYDCPVPIFDGGFHTYGLDWQPGYVSWYFDGLRVGRYLGHALDGKPSVYVMVNFKVGDSLSWPGAPDRSTPNSATMLIDYVRVYQTRPPNPDEQTARGA